MLFYAKQGLCFIHNAVVVGAFFVVVCLGGFFSVLFCLFFWGVVVTVFYSVDY